MKRTISKEKPNKGFRFLDDETGLDGEGYGYKPNAMPGYWPKNAINQ